MPIISNFASGSGGVTSFNGRDGEVVPQEGDYTAQMVGARPSDWPPTAADVGAVPTARKVNGKTLSEDISLSAADVSAVPTERKINGKPLNADINLSAADVGAVSTARKVNGKALSEDISLSAADVGAATPADVNGKQDKLAGTAGQVVGFDASGNAVAQATPDVGVTSFNGRTGAVTPASGDYTAAQVGALPISGGTLTGDLTIKGSGNYGTKINFGDGDYVHIAEPTDDCLEIKAKKINFVVSATSDDKFTLNGTAISGGGVGKSMAGQSVKPTSDTTVTAKTGAEIFNDYRTRAYSGDTPSAGNVAAGTYSRAEGSCTTASGDYSYAGGYSSEAYGRCSCARGFETFTYGSYSTAIGYGTRAGGQYQTVIGIYNIENMGNNNQLIAGKGTSDSARANSCRIISTGVYADGSYHSSGADYAEMFEWADKNLGKADRAGLFVTLDGDKLRIAGPEDDYVLGIVSGNPSIVGDVHDDQWHGMFLYDVFGRPIFEDVELPEEMVEFPNPDNPEETVTKVIAPARTERRQKLNPDYDTSQLPYTPRSERPEWATIGLMGKLVAVDDGTCQTNGWAAVGVGGIATASTERTKYRVMQRLDETHVRVMIL